MNSGILLLDKPTGSSSAKALYPVKRLFPGSKVGHTGTLDPFASGLLVILVGHATRLSRFFLKLDKHYTGILKFGEETDTLDRLGAVLSTGPVPARERVIHEASRFIGKTLQKPPSFSALKVQGRRAYSLAREGITPDLASREILVHTLEITPCNVSPCNDSPCNDTDNVSAPGELPDRYLMEVHCESGTYIRALARDIGRASGSFAFLQELRRTKVGPFDVSESNPERLIPVPEALRRLGAFPVITADHAGSSCIRMGKDPLRCLPEEAREVIRSSEGTYLLVVDPDGAEVALLEAVESTGDGPADTVWKYTAVFPAPPRGDNRSGQPFPSEQSG